jgi:putative PIG3 family NAD(P)H quinone oxidoreductase
MRCIEIAEFGPPEGLRLVERPTPEPAAGEVLIEVQAAGVNRPDVIQRYGHYAPPPGASDIPGLEVAGIVRRVGAGGSRWQAGDAVCALVAGGGYADWCVAPEGQCLPIPSGCTPTEAAAIPETFFTVWTNVFQRGGLAAGQWLLLHGGTSGIGTTAIQLAVARGAQVAATAGSDEKCAACLRLGAAHAWNYRSEDWVARTREATGGRGADVALDMVGGDYTARNLEALATEGRLVQIAFLKSPTVTLDLSQVMRRRLWITVWYLMRRCV